MPNMNFYTYVHITKFLMTNLMKQGLITATAVIKILVLYQIVVKRNAKFINPTWTVT